MTRPPRREPSRLTLSRLRLALLSTLTGAAVLLPQHAVAFQPLPGLDQESPVPLQPGSEGRTETARPEPGRPSPASPAAGARPNPGPAEPSVTAAHAVSSAPSTEVPQRIRPGILAIGLVTLDETNRTVRFPVVVNQRAGLIEYAVVTTRGKVHESLFRTEAEPRHIHLAMLLLGARPANTNLLSEDPGVLLDGDPVSIEVSWVRRGKEVRRPLTDFIRVTDPALAAPTPAWVYNGSFLIEGTFAAQQGGSIVALITDPTALANNPRPDRADDEIHQVRSKGLPPDRARVEIVMRLRRGRGRLRKRSRHLPWFRGG